jgi:hypothetical protein
MGRAGWDRVSFRQEERNRHSRTPDPKGGRGVHERLWCQLLLFHQWDSFSNREIRWPSISPKYATRLANSGMGLVLGVDIRDQLGAADPGPGGGWVASTARCIADYTMLRPRGSPAQTPRAPGPLAAARTVLWISLGRARGSLTFLTMTA